MGKKALEIQFQRLIMTPLAAIAREASEILTRVIVIDALDECKGDRIVGLICRLLSQLHGLGAVRLRVFLTSRSAPHIVGAFKNIPHRSLSLLDFSDETKGDISAFLEEGFAKIKADNNIMENPWPRPKDLDRLLALATNPSPLFIYAATLCRFVDDGTDNPTDQLEHWLDQADSNASQLNGIYTPILNRLLFVYKAGEERQPITSEARANLLKILGAIALLVTPLSAPALAALLDMNPGTVNFSLQRLHAVLDIPSDPTAPVEILHKSFSDYLLRQEGTGISSFQVDRVATHAMLASKCIDRMNREDGLQYDMCKLRDPSKFRDDINKDIIHDRIPLDLEYACVNWAFHMQHGGPGVPREDKAYKFLQKHFLHWLEGLSLLRELPAGITSLRQLIKVGLAPGLYLLC